MKLVKLSVVALALGLFAASCGSNDATNEVVDSTPVVEPMPETPTTPVAPTTDSPVVAPKADSPVAPATTTAAPEVKK